MYALMGDGGIRHLPGGIDQYIELRRGAAGVPAVATPGGASPRGKGGGSPSQALVRAARKEVTRVERAMAKLDAREARLHEDMAAAAADHGRLRALNAQLTELVDQREQLESDWLDASEQAGA